MPDFSFEDAAGGMVAGIDEAGRGPWAGPVVAAAVILNRASLPDGIHDSKQLSVSKRERIFDRLHEVASVGVGLASREEIDQQNILNATKLAMQRAYAELRTPCDMVLVDGNFIPDDLPCSAQAIVKGDSRSLSIAAASIIAKVTRDRIMAELAHLYPGYGWERNAGYGTKAHREAIAELGITPEHRRSFRPIREYIERYGQKIVTTAA